MLRINYEILCCSAILMCEKKKLKFLIFNITENYHVVLITLIAIINDYAISNDAYRR